MLRFKLDSTTVWRYSMGFLEAYQSSNLAPIFSFSHGEAHNLHPLVPCDLARYGIVADMNFFLSVCRAAFQPSNFFFDPLSG